MTVLSSDAIRAAVRDGMPQLVEDLRALVEIPSIAFPGFDRGPVLETAELTASLLRAAGCDVRMLELPEGPPAVFGEIPAPPGAPTVLLYAHYDIQPIGDPQAWRSEPYELTERDGRLYGRGTADNKSGICMHLAAIRAFDGKPPVGIKVIIEGEEETGKSDLEEYVVAHPDLFAADMVVVADMGNWRVGEPTLVTSLRGVTDCEIEVRTLAAPVHSGKYGGPVPDALMALMRALVSLTDDDANVTIDGLETIPWSGYEPAEEDIRVESGMLDGVEYVGEGSLGEKLWAKPSVNVIGIDAPPIDGSRNAIVHEARARVSLRLSPTQDPAEALELLVKHLEHAVPWGAQVSVTPGAIGPGFWSEDSGPEHDLAHDALAIAYGKRSVAMGSGGSIPLVSAFAQALPSAEIVLWGAEDGACAIHAPNESVDRGELERASLAEALLLARLGA
ncbi:MAG: dipeptidase [Actinobacteria bacterium HGW-Actinobacteria-6]|jgi:acetylornithine deacetylase/succinyl-diaminopimelate desuccinylase-like protein|nr:MAG: dipeptidase [Actinobacteria bacterium HGW-Actinobacteria-6]